MGVRVVVGEDESVRQALKRLRKLVHGLTPPGCRQDRPWHKRNLVHHVKPGQLARRQALWKKLNKWRAESWAERMDGRRTRRPIHGDAWNA